MKPIIILTTILCVLFNNGSFAQAYNITANFTGFRNNKGILYTELYNSKDGYPKEPKKAFRLLYSQIINGRCTIVFDGIPKGSYAIACYHDENNNGKLDANFFGIPKEGTGASNNAKGFWGPPKFSDANFEVNGNVTQEIKINY